MILCDVRDVCLVPVYRKGEALEVPVGSLPGYRCGFEKAGTIAGCPKRRRLDCRREGAEAVPSLHEYGHPRTGAELAV